MRGQEALDVLHGRQLLLHPLEYRLYVDLLATDPGDAGHGRVDFIESAQPDVGHRGQVRRRCGCQRRRFKHNIGIVSKYFKGKEELVGIRALLQGNDGAQFGQRLTLTRYVERFTQHGVDVHVGLADGGLLAVDADAHAGQRDVTGHGSRVERDKQRCVEQVAVAVELADLEQHVAVGHAGIVVDVEQQEELLADTHRVVLLDLVPGQCAVVDRHQAQLALPRAVTGDLVAEHEGKAVVPVDQAARRNGIDIPAKHAVHIDAPPVDRVIGQYHVLQRGLQVLVRGIR